jgi:hypothetical protein
MAYQTQTPIILTRYLYLKSNVSVALLNCILNKDQHAFFWAYELYFSGFMNDTFETLFKIYYDFFASLNPMFEYFIIEKFKEQGYKEPNLVYIFVNNLLSMSFNSDLYFMRTIYEKFEIDYIYNENTSEAHNVETWIDNKDYRSILNFIFKNENRLNTKKNNIYILFVDCFKEKGLKIIKTKQIEQFELSCSLNIIKPSVIALTKIMSFFVKLAKKNNDNKDKQIFIYVDTPKQNCPYTAPFNSNSVKHYNILKEINYNSNNYESYFTNQNVDFDIYYQNWLYYASYSPFWNDKIVNYGGNVNHTKKNVEFNEIEEEIMQEFYSLYGLEPDNQPNEIITYRFNNNPQISNWLTFNIKYNKERMFEIYTEELEEMNNENIVYC